MSQPMRSVRSAQGVSALLASAYISLIIPDSDPVENLLNSSAGHGFQVKTGILWNHQESLGIPRKPFDGIVRNPLEFLGISRNPSKSLWRNH
ncbi:hypothetical protein PoB_001156800 [Plakobranchus ocellatus]|uniref:Uncharacterized protein n=1 Tax=Plakobranchus ocellatus TaxID=259542 RepID=A0AAV3YRT8_9GAST|nr:hypothetical protein PoB_001156800 [Plakobranchus ocellatus]